MCECRLKYCRYSACLHREKKLTECWKADWRRASCLASIITAPCRPRLIKSNKIGCCEKCVERFRPFNIARPDKIKRFVQYKSSIGKGTVAIDAQQIPLEAVFDIVDMRKQPFRSSPMRASLSGPDEEERRAPVREAGTDQIIDLADLVGSPAPESEGDVSHVGTVSSFGADFGDMDLMLEKSHQQEASCKSITRTIIPHPTPSYIPKGCVPKLATAPKAPFWRRSSNPPRVYLVPAEPSQSSPSGRQVRVSLNRDAVPVPPPQKLSAIFTGCGKHGFKPVVGCAVCQKHSFKERGIPSDSYIHLRDCRSAPPVLVSVRTPTPKYTCAPQAQCFCDRFGPEFCLSCLERKGAEEVLKSAWI